MRLDHLLSKEEEVRKNVVYCLVINEWVHRLDDRGAMEACFRERIWQTGCIWRIERSPKWSEAELRVKRDTVLTEHNSILLVAMRSGDTPVPIPNTMVKTWSADGTALETVWESRWAPDQKKKNRRDPDENRCWFYQWFKKKRYFLFKWLIKHQSALYLENCIHEIWLS